MRVSVLVWVLASAVMTGPVRGAAPPVGGLPAELALVPADSWAFVSIRPAALFAGEPGRDLRRASRLTTMNLRELAGHATLATCGVPVEELERVSLVVGPAGMAWLFTSVGPVDPATVLRSAGIRAAAQQRHGHRVHAGGAGNAAAFVGPRTFLLGPIQAVEAVLAASSRRRPTGPLAEALRTATRYHVVAMGHSPHPDGFGRAPDGVLAGLAKCKEIAAALRQLRSARVALHFGPNFELSAHAVFATAAGARQAKQLCDDGRALALRHLDELGEVLAERFVMVGGPVLARDVFAFFRAVKQPLGGAHVAQNGTSLAVELQLPGRGALWALGMLAMPPTRVVPVEEFSELSGPGPPPGAKPNGG